MHHAAAQPGDLQSGVRVSVEFGQFVAAGQLVATGQRQLVGSARLPVRGFVLLGHPLSHPH